MIVCSLCGNKNTRLQHRIGRYQYFKCLNCFSLFLKPQPSASQLKRYYLRFSNNTLLQETRLKKQADSIIVKLRQLYPKGQTLLDVGAGYGLMLKSGQEANLTVLGIEPSKYCFEYLQKNHLPSINLDINQYLYSGYRQKFDFITLSHVIEHFPSPVIVKQISALLNKRGILYIETPNLDSYLYRFEKDRYTFLTPPEHLWILSLKTIKYIYRRQKSVLFRSVATYSYPEHLMGIIKKKVLSDRLSDVGEEDGNIKKSHKQSFVKKLKYQLFDKTLAPLLIPILNINHQGSFLQIFLQKT